MMANLTAVLTLSIAAVLAAVPAAGQTADVSFDAGRVTITAHEAPLAAVLGAWERHGGSQFVGAGRLPDRPVSVQLVDVPEREALRVLLRSAAGYVAIPKAAGAAGGSAYERVLIMAETTAARRLPAAGAGSAAGAGGTRPTDTPAGAQTPADPGELDELADLDDEGFDDLDELELVESLRRRYRAATADGADATAPSFRRQPDGSPLGTAPRPGMVIAAEEPRDGPNPPRPRNRAR